MTENKDYTPSSANDIPTNAEPLPHFEEVNRMYTTLSLIHI